MLTFLKHVSFARSDRFYSESDRFYSELYVLQTNVLLGTTIRPEALHRSIMLRGRRFLLQCLLAANVPPSVTAWVFDAWPTRARRWISCACYTVPNNPTAHIPILTTPTLTMRLNFGAARRVPRVLSEVR